MAIEASRIALKYRTPVILLTDGYLANGAEPWRLPDVSSLPDISVDFATDTNGTAPDGSPVFFPFMRDETTLARPWAIPGTPGLEHRIGGLEKADVTGDVSYDPGNHSRMTELRQAKIDGIANDIPPAEFVGAGTADTLLVGWGSTHGSITAAAELLRADGIETDHLHLTHIAPMATNVGETLKNYRHVIVPELNRGQLVQVLRGMFLVDAKGIPKMEGLPFTGREIADAVKSIIAAEGGQS